jgi:hypothetical protein
VKCQRAGLRRQRRKGRTECLHLHLTVAPIHSDRAAQMRARVTSSKPVPISNLTRVPRGSHDEIDHTAIHTQGCTRRG